MPNQAARINAELTAGFEQDVIETVETVQEELEASTPEATGLAARSSIPAIGEGDTTPVNASTTSVGAQAAKQEAGKQEIRQWKVGQPDITITNAAEHIVALNAGSSPKAPAGFVDLAALRAVNRG